MAAKKKKKAASKKRAARPAKSKKAPAKKSKKIAKKPAKKAKKSVKAVAKKAPAKKAPAKKKTIGEGDYAASRSFLKDQSNFVEKNRADIPAMGKDAERAMDGPQGDMLRDAEATAAARSRDTF